MRLWAPVPAAWVWHADDILVIPADRPLQQPLRLTGSAADCWVALLEVDAAASARTVAMALWSESMVGDRGTLDLDSVSADVEEFFVSLAEVGVVVEDN